MAQADYDLAAHLSGLNQRTEINSIFQAILSNNSGSTAPAVTVAYMMWVDTSNATYYYLKMRNHDNTAWVTLFIYTVATKVITPFIINSPTTNAIPKIQADGTLKNSSIIEDSSGNLLLVSGTGGLGYGTGSGGTVIQATSKTTGVTLNKPTGIITTSNSSLASNAVAKFAINNTIIGSLDTISFSLENFGDYYTISHQVVSSGCWVFLKNIDTIARSDAVSINFTIIKGVNS